jgi:hypothetical protein
MYIDCLSGPYLRSKALTEQLLRQEVNTSAASASRV